ncbi:hypothetical protein NMG60_11033523 [Bertholletia excelsa]
MAASGINMAFIWSEFYIFQQQIHIPANSRLPILVLLFPVAQNFVELQYQGKQLSPFENRPITSRVAVASFLLYCFAYDAELRFSMAAHHSPVYKRIAGLAMELLGSLSLVSMAAVLLPDRVGPILWVLYTLFLVSGTLQVVRNWLRRRVIGGVVEAMGAPEWRLRPVFERVGAWVSLSGGGRLPL